VSSARPAPRDPGAASGPPPSRGQALGDRSLASGARSPDPLGGLVLRQFLQAPPDRARRNPGRHRDRRDPPITRGERLCRCDQTTAPFIEKRGHRRKPLSDGFDIDHHYNIWYPSQVVNLYLTLSKVDSIISGQALRTVLRGLDARIHVFASTAPRRGWPGQAHGCPVQLFAAATRRRHRHNLWLPVAGLVPATHVFECGSIDGRESVDGRDEPGQGDRGLYRARYKQPLPLNRTAATFSPDHDHRDERQPDPERRGVAHQDRGRGPED